MTSIFTNDNNPNVYSIEPNQKFLKELAIGIINEISANNSKSGFELSDAVILLPTKRAARELAHQFLIAREEEATILPRIRTLGDIDPDDINLQELDGINTPAISSTARQFLLSKFIAARNNALSENNQGSWGNDSVAVLGAADSLADLLESAELGASPDNPVDWSKLDTLVEDSEFAKHWELSTKFLEIVTKAYPEYLKQSGLIDPALRRRLAIEKLTADWKVNPPDYPVIIAGSTGAVQSTRGLMHVVSRLEKGAVILPGLDKQMGSAWLNIASDHGHPQRAMHDTISYIGIRREEVKTWSFTAAPSDYLLARRTLLNTALIPREATADWRKIIDTIGKETIENGLNGLSLIEAETEDEEAGAIALEMRETLEHSGQTCVLVTPSADIARRVSAKMQKWGIKLDISSGVGINETKLGVFIKLVAEFTQDYGNPIIIASLLSHPHCHFGFGAWDKKLNATSLELELLRGPRRKEELSELLNLAQNMEDAQWKNPKVNKDRTIKLLENILEVSRKIEDLKQELNPQNLSDVAKFLLGACELVAANNDTDGGFIYKGEAGKAAAAFFSDLIENGEGFIPKDLPRNLDDGIKVIISLLKNVVVRPRGTNPNLSIIGPLEARLLSFDKTILAGLDEGVWPKPPDNDPFLSRPMREKLGLQSRDLRLGLSAHDFAQFATAPKVIITRAARRSGSPAVPSRWIWRLKTLINGALGVEIGEKILKDGSNALELFRALEPQKQAAINIEPRPTPPLDARPKRYSATQIETWIRDPYKLYIQQILKLRDLEPIGGEISAKERGSAIHAALEILPLWSDDFPDDPFQALMDIMKQELIAVGYYGDELSDELASLEPTATLIADRAIEDNANNIKNYAEKWANYSLETDAGAVEVFAKIDRIDIDKENNYEIWDYKTGKPPTDKQIASLISPQLPVTAFILQKSHKFQDDRENKSAKTIKKIKAFGHIRVGNDDPKFMEYTGKLDRGKTLVTIPDLITNTEKTIRNLFEKYMKEDMPYVSKPRPQFTPKVNYEDMVDRLARRAEWASADDNEGDNNE